MLVATTSFSAFAAMPNGTVVIGTKAFDLTYANNSANVADITAAIVAGGSIYVKDFSGNWIDNSTGVTISASVIQGVVYKSDTGVVTNYDAGDKDYIATITVESVSAINAINVDYGTAAANVTLPAKITLNLSNKTTKEVDVTWKSTNYDGNKIATYTFIGTYVLPTGVIGIMPVVTASVVVVADQANAAVSLVVKDSPGTSYKTLGTIKAGTTVEVYDGVPIGLDQGDWYSFQQYGWSKIKYENEYAWVKTNELKFVNPYNWLPGIKEEFENDMVKRGYASTKTGIQYKNPTVGATGAGFYQVYTDLCGLQPVVTVNVKTGWYHG